CDKCAPTFEKPMAVVRRCDFTADLPAEPHLAGAAQLCIARFSATHSCPRRTPRPGEGLPSRPDKADAPRVPAVDGRSVLLFVLGKGQGLQNAGLDVRCTVADIRRCQGPRLLPGARLPYALRGGKRVHRKPVAIAAASTGSHPTTLGVDRFG